MSRTTWDNKYLDLAKFYSTWSKDPSTKVGAVVVNWDQAIEFGGYNGFPRGVEDYQWRLEDRTYKYPMMVHAELNAILKAGHYARGSTLYIWCPFICQECVKAAIQSGIKEIIIKKRKDDALIARWKDSDTFATTMLLESGINYREVL